MEPNLSLPKEDELIEFLDAVGTVAAGAKIFSDGVQLVDDVKFWKWFTTDVINKANIEGVSIPLNDARAIQDWIASKTKASEITGVETLTRGRGFEYDFVRSKQHDPIEFLKGNFWRGGTLLEDRAGVDAVKTSIFGPNETHQLKTATSDTGARVNLQNYTNDGNQPVDAVQTNEKIANWRGSEAGRIAISARGDNHPNLKAAVSDIDLKGATDQRMEQAQSGCASPSITFEGVVTEVGRGALVGAVVGVGVSTLTNYGKYKRGEIDGGEFGDLMLKDSARGALLGGSMATVNIPVQIAAHALGVGNPVTIPVMIVVGVGLRYVIDPIFGKGEYAKHLRDMEISTDLSHGIAQFAGQCQSTFEMQRPFLEAVVQMGRRAEALNDYSDFTDRALDDAISGI